MGLEKMKIVILFLAIIAININVTNQMCRNVDIIVNSSIQEKKQTFGFDVKNIRNVKFGQNKDQFDKSATLIPLNQVGLLLNKKESTGPIDETHLKYLRNEKDQAWIPYSYVAQWTRNGFVLSGQMSRTSTSVTEKPMVNLEFVNDANLGNVSNDDMNSFLTRISENTRKRQTIKKNLKNSILKAQNTYLSAKALYEQTKKDQKDLKKKIADLEAELKKVITKITQIDSEITKINKDVVVKTVLKAESEDTLETKTDELKISTSELVSLEKELANFRPQSTTELEQLRDQFLIKMSFPKNQPEFFKTEYGLNMQWGKKVEESYDLCNNKAENAEKCFKTTKKVHVRRRLR